MGLLDHTLGAIRLPDNAAESAAAKRLDLLTKPPGSLGRLEEIVRRYAAIRRDHGARFGRAAITVFVADHGVAAEGVSAYPQAVTVEMLRNIASGGAAISVLAKRFGYELRVIDIGVATDTSAKPFPGVTYQRVGAGTSNFAREAAMTAEQVRRALEIGIGTANELINSGVTLIGIGEMGIANSTSAAAVLCALTGLEPARIVGRGTGLDDAGVRRKIAVIERALELHRKSLRDGESILAALGGFEIAGMAGVCLGSAARSVPVVVDGFIATAAAAAATHMCKTLMRYLFFSHCSAEGGHKLVLESLAARALLDLEMRLGEGTGAALAMNVIESALELFHQMATFESAGVSEKLR